MQKIKSDSIAEISLDNSLTRQLENITNFLAAARKYGLSKAELFSPLDLVDGSNIAAVVTTILTIQCYASDVYAPSPDPFKAAPVETWQQTRERRRRTVDIIGTLDSQGRPDVLIDSIEQKEERRPEKSLQRKSSQPELRPKDTSISRLLIDKRPQNIRTESDGAIVSPASPPKRRSSTRRPSYHGNDTPSPSRVGVLQVAEGKPQPFSLSIPSSNMPADTRGSSSRGRSESAIDTSLYSSSPKSPSAIRRGSRSSNLSDSPSASPSRRSIDSGKLVFPSSPLIERRRGSLPLASTVEDEETVPVEQSGRPSAPRRSSSRSSRREEDLLAKLDSYRMSNDSKPNVSPSASPNTSLFTQALPRQHKRFNSDAQVPKDDLKDIQPQRTRHDSMSAAGRGLSKAGSKDVVKERLILNERGKIVAQYQLGNVCIGKGQFGAVYRALNQDTGQVVAVKRIKLQDKADSEIEQLMREVELLKKLSHPSVVHYEGFIKTDGYINIILEYVENGSLLHTLRSFGNFPERLVAKYTVMILEGLSYLHKQHVVHCDLKAANILTTKHANVKLSDFGVSLQLKLVQDMKEDVQGTPNWMAPEIIKLEGASTASDIWSLGCTIIELLAGRPPYADLLAFTAMYRIVQDECPPLPDKASNELKDFLRQCFRKDPKMRPSADSLFEHEWIAKNWSHKELRPQESVPYLRRLSAEARRVEEAANIGSMPSPVASKVSFESPGRPQLRETYSVDSPSFHRPYTIENPESLPPPSPSSPLYIPSFMGRKSVDEDGRPSTAPILGRTFSSPPTNVAGGHNNGISSLAHRFVKSSFSKSVECKLCRGSVKKHAVVCEECGLVCHATCAKTYATSRPCNSHMRFHASSSSAQIGLDAPLPPGSPTGIPYDNHSQANLMTPPPTAVGLPFPTLHNNLSTSALSSSPNSPTLLSSSPVSSRHGKLIKRTKRDSIQASQNAAHVATIDRASGMTGTTSPPSTSGEYSSIFSGSPSRGTLATATSTATAATSASNTSTGADERRKSSRSTSSDHGHRRGSKSKSRLKGDGDCVIS